MVLKMFQNNDTKVLGISIISSKLSLSLSLSLYIYIYIYVYI